MTETRAPELRPDAVVLKLSRELASGDVRLPSLPEDLGLETEGVGETIASALAAGRSMLSEVEAKALLAGYGIPVVPTDVAVSPAEVAVSNLDTGTTFHAGKIAPEIVDQSFR